MATAYYGMHYQEHISQTLTQEQKHDIVKRISKLTLRSPIWLDKDEDYKDRFPEIANLVSEGIPLSGLYLCAIMGEIVKELLNN